MLKRLGVLTAFLAVACGLLIPTFSAAQTPSPSRTPSLLIKPVNGLSARGQAAAIASNGGVEVASIPALRLHVVQVPASDQSHFMQRYRVDPQVVRVEENKTREVNAIPSDPLYSNQWALPKIGWDSVFGAVTPTGTATVALLDTGIDAQHPDLIGNVVAGTS